MPVATIPVTLIYRIVAFLSHKVNTSVMQKFRKCAAFIIAMLAISVNTFFNIRINQLKLDDLTLFLAMSLYITLVFFIGTSKVGFVIITA